MKKTLVLGIGNLLLRDEGVGVHAAQALMQLELPEGVKVLDIGTAILDALPELEDADRVIVVDAIKADGTPGSVYRLSFDECAGKETIASMHGFDLARVLALTGRKSLPEVVVLGVEPLEITWSLDLSPPVQEALPFLLEELRKEIAGSSAE